VMIGRRRANFPYPGLRGRSAGRSKCVSCRRYAAHKASPPPDGGHRVHDRPHRVPRGVLCKRLRC
jgi:hypothetical protein